MKFQFFLQGTENGHPSDLTTPIDEATAKLLLGEEAVPKLKAYVKTLAVGHAHSITYPTMTCKANFTVYCARLE